MSAKHGAHAPPETSVTFNIGLNVFCSVALVSVNKLLVTYGFKYILLLTACHFLAGYFLLSAISSPSLGINLFTRPPALPVGPVAIVGAAGVFSIVMMNYSLQLNSVGTYQILKASQLGTTMLLSYFQGLGRVTVPEIGAAALVTAGAIITTASDVRVTILGLIVGFGGVTATSQYQIWQGTVQTRNRVTSTQALYLISLPQAVIAAIASLVFEVSWSARFSRLFGGSSSTAELAAEADGKDLDSAAAAALPPIDDVLSHHFTASEIFIILLTCVLAAGLNYSTIAVIGKTSAVTMQFVNQLKTAAIVGVGLLLFPQPITTASAILLVLGLTCVFTGVGYYTSLKNAAPIPSGATAAKAPSDPNAPPGISPREEGVVPPGGGVMLGPVK